MASLQEYLDGVDKHGNQLDPARVAKYRAKYLHRGMIVDKPLPLKTPRPTSDKIVVTLASGPKFQELKAINWPRIQEYAKRCGADVYCIEEAGSDYGFIGKFALGQFFDAGYERLCFLDIDAVPVVDCPSIFNSVSGDLAMHNDRHLLPQTDWYEAEIKALCESQGWQVVPGVPCWNTGVIVASKAAKAAFDPPKEPFPRSHTAEQTLITLNAVRAGIRVENLPRQWNEQWWPNKRIVERSGTNIYHWSNAPHAARCEEMSKLIGVEWTPKMRSRGAGDLVAKLTHATGIDRVVEAVAGKDCGCKKRQKMLNDAVPFQ